MIDTKNSKILIVGNVNTPRHLLAKFLEEEGYICDESPSGAAALVLLESYTPDLIFLATDMPQISGFELTLKIKATPSLKHIPIIMFSSTEDRRAIQRGLSLGVEDFISEPFNANEVQVRARNLLRMKLTTDLLACNNQDLERKVRQRTNALGASFEESVYVLMRAAEYRDDDSGTHVRRISRYCRVLARVMGLGQSFYKTIYLASPMHDIGKIGIPDGILLKPGPLSRAEWEVMKSHTDIGNAVLENSASPYMEMGQQISCSHHENYDGTGYPQGLKGEDIPLAARIMSICDVYDALRSKRAHKNAFDHIKARDIILVGDDRIKPSKFDPQVLAAFSKVATLFEKIYQTT